MQRAGASSWNDVTPLAVPLGQSAHVWVVCRKRLPCVVGVAQSGLCGAFVGTYTVAASMHQRCTAVRAAVHMYTCAVLGVPPGAISSVHHSCCSMCMGLVRVSLCHIHASSCTVLT